MKFVNPEIKVISFAAENFAALDAEEGSGRGGDGD